MRVIRVRLTAAVVAGAAVLAACSNDAGGSSENDEAAEAAEVLTPEERAAELATTPEAAVEEYWQANLARDLARLCAIYAPDVREPFLAATGPEGQRAENCTDAAAIYEENLPSTDLANYFEYAISDRLSGEIEVITAEEVALDNGVESADVRHTLLDESGQASALDERTVTVIYDPESRSWSVPRQVRTELAEMKSLQEDLAAITGAA